MQLCIHTENHRNVCNGNMCIHTHNYDSKCALCVHTQHHENIQYAVVYSYPESQKHACHCVFMTRTDPSQKLWALLLLEFDWLQLEHWAESKMFVVLRVPCRKKDLKQILLPAF